ncbi:MAG: hypothetical protein HDR22_02525 [Lachnospiraceae bacterium]|nr:hypothetical protein [Lachnospiraceae bacterium]
MKKMKRMISMLVILTVLAGSIAGCGKKETAATDDGEVTAQETGGEEGLRADDSDNDLSSSLKQKYAGTESDKYEYANPVYNVERDHAFVFEQVGTRYQEDDSCYDDIGVYIDSNFINPIVPEMEYDSDKQTLTISPNKDMPALRYLDDEYTEGVRNWGNAPKYWIVQKNDFATGEPLKKPIVTLFTVKADLDAPTVTFDVDEKGYARLSWKPVAGATGYKIYELSESAEYGISLESPYLIGETTDTSFTKFPGVEEYTPDTELEEATGIVFGVTTQNIDFYNSGIDDEESGLSDVYCVVAVNGEKKSNVSNFIYEKDVRNRLVFSRVFDYDNTGEKEEDYEVVREKVSELPSFQLIEMADGSIVPMAIDYANATWKESPYNVDLGDGNITINIHAGIQGTDFKITLAARSATKSTIDSDLAALAQKQKSVSGKSADVKPKNDIDYVPSTDNSSDKGKEPEETSQEPEESQDTSDAGDVDEIDESEEELAGDDGIDEAEEELAGDDGIDEAEEELAEGDGTDEAEEELAEIEGTDEEAEDPDAEELATTELTGDELNNIEVTATSALSAYIATYMLSHEEAIDLSMFPEAGDSDYLVNALMEAYNQNPLIGSLNRYAYDYDSSILLLDYEYSREEQQDMQEAVLAEADKVIGEIITDDMNDVEKEFAINNYLCSTAEYDYAALDNAEENNYQTVDHDFAHSFTPYGVLINKVGVCASYAGAFKVLADKADLDCYVVSGYLNGNLPHAWNRVGIDGQWITVDSTNNDNEKYANALLNIPDYMSSGFLVEDNTYLLADALAQMEADQEESEFYRVENRYYSHDELESQLEMLLAKGETFTIRTDYTITEEEMRELLQEALMNAQVPEVSVYMFLGVLTVEM